MRCLARDPDNRSVSSRGLCKVRSAGSVSPHGCSEAEQTRLEYHTTSRLVVSVAAELVMEHVNKAYEYRT
jgi:hypothetical protein